MNAPISPLKKFLAGGIAALGICFAAWVLITKGINHAPPQTPSIWWQLVPGLAAALVILAWGLLLFGLQQKPSGSQIASMQNSEAANDFHLRRLVETNDLVFWEADIWTWEFRYVGPQAEKLLGYPLKDWYRKNFWAEKIYAPDRISAIERCRRACRLRKSTEMDYRMVRADGQIIWVQDLITIPDNHSNVFRGCLINITARKEAEEALRRSEERFRRIFESGLIGVALTSREKKFLQVNDHLCTLLGYSREELTEKTWEDLTHPDDLKISNECFRQVVSSETDSCSFDKRFIHKSKKVIYTSISARCLRREDGSIDYFVVLLQDISERKLAEEALRHSEERFRSVVEGSIQGILIHQNWVVQYANPSLARMLGFEEPQEVIGLDLHSIVAPEYQPELKDRTRACLQGKRIGVHSGWKGVRKDGKEIWISSSAYSLSWNNGIALVGFLLDITEQKKAQDALRESEARFRDLFNNSPDAIFVESLEGAVLDANPAACRLHKMTAEELIGKNVLELVPPSRRNEIVLNDFTHLNAGDSYLVEGLSLASDGRVVPVEIRANLFEYAGDKALLLHVRDISERKELEEKIRQVEKMQAISRVAASAAHDFNNILIAINGYAETLLHVHAPGAPARQDVEEIIRSVDRAQSLTRQLLVFQNKEDSIPEAISLNALIQEKNKLLKTLIPKNIELVQNLCEPQTQIQADPAEIERVIVNLVLNSVAAIPENGTLTIATDEVFLDESYARMHVDVKPGHYFRLTVEDTGQGMTEEVRRRAFEPFFSTKGDQGTGLGLFNVYSIVKKCSGHIDLQTAPGRGTTIRLFFPIASAETDSPMVFNNHHQKDQRTILIVDDEVLIRPVYRRMLEGEGYQVLEAPGGTEALKLSRTHSGKIDLLLTDIFMPGINGWDLAKQLLGERPKMQVLYVSGFVDLDELIEQGSVSQESLLQKPFMPETLLTKVRNLLE